MNKTLLYSAAIFNIMLVIMLVLTTVLNEQVGYMSIDINILGLIFIIYTITQVTSWILNTTYFFKDKLVFTGVINLIILACFIGTLVNQYFLYNQTFGVEQFITNSSVLNLIDLVFGLILDVSILILVKKKFKFLIAFAAINLISLVIVGLNRYVLVDKINTTEFTFGLGIITILHILSLFILSIHLFKRNSITNSNEFGGEVIDG